MLERRRHRPHAGRARADRGRRLRPRPARGDRPAARRLREHRARLREGARPLPGPDVPRAPPSAGRRTTRQGGDVPLPARHACTSTSTGEDEIVLGPGEQFTIPPDTLHWFQAGDEARSSRSSRRGAATSSTSSAIRGSFDSASASCSSTSPGQAADADRADPTLALEDRDAAEEEREERVEARPLDRRRPAPSRRAHASCARRCARPCRPCAGRSGACRAPRRPSSRPRRARRARRRRRPRPAPGASETTKSTIARARSSRIA